MKKLLTGGQIVLESGIMEKDLFIEEGKIKSLLDPDDESPEIDEIIDVSDKLILPGVIDSHTHYLLHSRGTTTADDFCSGSKAAAIGGVTTFIDYIDHEEDKSLLEAARERIAAARESVLDFNLHQTVHYFNENIEAELREIRELGVSSLKIFTTYKEEGYMISEEDIPELLEAASDNNLLITVHAEDEEIIQASKEKLTKERDKLSLADHPDLRPAEAESKAVEKIAALAMERDLPLYIAHISAGKTAELMKKFRAQGGRIFGETTPHYLLLDRSYLTKEEAARYFMVPPLRDSDNQDIIWEALLEGAIQAIATDHCAFTLDQKNENSSPLEMFPGLPGSETLLPLIHHFGVNTGMMSYPELVKFLAGNPARIFGLFPERGIIREGAVADLVVFDPEKKMELKDEDVNSKANYSPYQGFKIRGWPVMTISRGEIITSKGSFVGKEGRGRFIEAGVSQCFTAAENTF